MQILYAMPFILLSGIGCVVCLVVPRLRGYLVAAAVGPVAFGFWGIVGFGALVLIADNSGGLIDLAVEHQGVLMLLPLYVLPGAFGAWFSIKFASALRRHLGL